MTHLMLKEVTNYPESDDRPMADNTLQFRWIVTIKENLESVERERPARDRIAELEAKLREAGIDPNSAKTP
jgi:hypothetical protein